MNLISVFFYKYTFHLKEHFFSLYLIYFFWKDFSTNAEKTLALFKTHILKK